MVSTVSVSVQVILSCFSSRLSPVCASPRLCQAQKCHTREFCVRTMTLSGSSRDTSISLILIQGECESSRMAVFFKLTQHNLRKTLPWCRWQLGQHTRTHGILTSNALPAKLPSFSERESLEPGSSVMASRQSIWQSWRWSF